MLSQTSKHALQILGYLAQYPGQVISGKDLSKATGVPLSYLNKVLRTLGQRGFVGARKGWNGGFQLKASALKRPIAEVVSAFESSGRRSERRQCLFGWDQCNGNHPCPLHNSWKQILDLNAALLDKTTVGMIADYLDKNGKRPARHQ